MGNVEIAEVLRDVAAAYKLQNEKLNKFKIVAYEKAADAVEHATSELRDLWEEGKLDDVPGIGPSIAEHLSDIFKTGKSKHFDDLTKTIPPIVFELMKIPGIGVKTASKLVNELKLKSLKDLRKAITDGRIAEMEGFGVDSQEKISKSLTDYEKKPPSRHLLPYAYEIASEVAEWVRKDAGVKRVDMLGSLRRQATTIGDIDLSALSTNPDKTIEHFTKFPRATRVIEKGERSTSIIIPGNIQIDLMVCKPQAYGSLLQHFTGSKHHNIALREYALKHQLSVSDYGIYDLNKNRKLIEFSDEEKFYRFLGMDYIPPEMREDTGEIELALESKLPKLVELKDIKGDFHIHSDFDIETSHDIGSASMKDIVKRAIELNYEYISFSEHNPSKGKHNASEIVKLLKRKREIVDELNYSTSKEKNNRGFKVFNSLEIDILPDGSLPVPTEGLETLDFALVSIHSSFDLSRDEMTKRVLKAFDNPKVRIFAHPTARKLNEREGVDLDWEKIFDACLAKNIWVEINGDPARLDLPDSLVHDAVKRKVKMTIDTDTHHLENMDNMKWGISVARRGWATGNDIINTLSLREFEKLLK